MRPWLSRKVASQNEVVAKLSQEVFGMTGRIREAANEVVANLAQGDSVDIGDVD